MTLPSRSKIRSISLDGGESGFTLVEILLTISLVGILSATGIAFLTQSVQENRFDGTLAEMRQIRAALVGSTEQSQGGARTNFGYLGDIGSLPTAAQGLQALITRPSGPPVWAVNANVRFGVGWNGPYLASTVGGEDPLKDAWGRNYTYAPGPPATITSLGADGLAGGTGYDTDIVVTVPNDLRVGTVFGFVADAGSPYNGNVQVEINYANGVGVATSQLLSVPAASRGSFQFNNIPLGFRSLSVYVPTKASPTRTIGPVNITVDKGKFMVPVQVTDLNPGGIANPGAGDLCPTPANRIVERTPKGSTVGTHLTFTMRATVALTISSVAVVTNSGTPVRSISFGPMVYNCGGPNTLAPCPGASGSNLTLTNAYNANVGNINMDVDFSSTVNGESEVTLVFGHSSGCDKLALTGLF